MDTQYILEDSFTYPTTCIEVSMTYPTNFNKFSYISGITYLVILSPVAPNISLKYPWNFWLYSRENCTA